MIAAIKCDVLGALFAGEIRLRQIIKRQREKREWSTFYDENKYMIGYLWRWCDVDTPEFNTAFLSRVCFEIHLHLIVTKENPRARIDVDGHRYLMITLEMRSKSSTKIESELMKHTALNGQPHWGQREHTSSYVQDPMPLMHGT